ncbi:MAG TPA: diaminopimelate epimerase [Pseudomonadales bacterium]|nr:diaminopimelate epimerase [Pseudomonadales bacterium]
MLLKFSKMHGLGNDFAVFDFISQRGYLTSEQVRLIADRHLGIGCDQVLIVEAPDSPDVDFSYRIFNADGGEVEQCGNGARCFARFVREQRLTNKRQIRVQTLSGIIELNVLQDERVCVDMGTPQFTPSAIPFDAPHESGSYMLDVNGQTLDISAVSMGNPHCVLRVDDVDTAPVAALGPAIEQHPRFPKRVNAGFMQVLDQHHIRLRVFERGSGETLACGTGACAAAVAGIRRGWLTSPVCVSLPGGDLLIEWAGENHAVMMTGPAVTVFRGQIRL